MNNKRSAFVGLMSRAKNVIRWPLMSQFEKEQLSDHIYQCAYIGHLLGAIAADIFNENVCPDRVAAMALYHEGGEINGLADMPKPAKYYSPEITKAIKKLESDFESKLLDTLPLALRDRYRPLIMQNKAERHAELAKVADIVSAFFKCDFELSKSNKEFSQAYGDCHSEIVELRKKDQVVDYFFQIFMPLANSSFDDLSKSMINT
jgi:5'-deoxynucleotidase